MPSQLSRVATSALVRQYAKGAAQSAMDRMTMAKFLSPVVPVPGTKFNYWSYDARAPYRIMNTKRAIHGGAAILETGGTEILSELVPNAIDAPIDQAEQLAEPTLILTLQERADEAAQAAALAHEYEVINLALASVGAGTDVNAAQDSDVDIKAILDQAILDVIKSAKVGSMLSVRMIVGASAGMRLMNHASIRSLYKGGAKSTATPGLMDLSSLFLGNPTVMQNLTVYDSAAEGLAEANNWVLDNAVLIFVNSDSPTRRDPGFMKTFALAGEIMRSGTYMSQDGRQEFAKMDWYTKPTVTNASAIKRINLNAA